MPENGVELLLAQIEPPTPRKKVEPPRDGFGRYRIVDPVDGREKSYTRATTVAATLDDTFALLKWKQRKALAGFIKRPDLLAKAHMLREHDKAAYDAIVDEAMEAAGSSVAANFGTACHGILEWLDAGEECPIPDLLADSIVAYRKTIDRSGIEILPEFIERIVVLNEWRIAGTFDRIVRFFGVNYIADLKTGATLEWSWPSIAVQMSLYSRADSIYDPETRTHSPMPDVDQDWGLVIHLPVGGSTCTLYWVDLEAGWEAAAHSVWARRWRRRNNLTLPFTGQPPRGPGF
jgi:hypothetical protein